MAVAASLTQMATKLSDLQVLIETSKPPSEGSSIITTKNPRLWKLTNDTGSSVRNIHFSGIQHIGIHSKGLHISQDGTFQKRPLCN
jgi:hypothetical protein